GVIVQESDGSNTQVPDDTIQFAVADFVVSDNSGKPLVTLESDVARTADIGPGFYGINVGETDDDPVFSGIETIKFNSDSFYVTQQDTDTAIVNLRPNADGTTASNLGGGEGVFAQEVANDLQFKSLVAGNEISLSSDGSEITITSQAKGFYGIVVKDDAGTVVVTDSVQFPDADFDVSASGDGALVALDATVARLADLPPAFYGIVVKDDVTTVVTDSVEFQGADFDVSASGDGALVALDATVAHISDIPPGFYGIIVQESDGSNTQVPDDTIQFAVADFVVSDNAGKPLVTLESDVARTADIGPGFYGINVGETDDDPVFSGINTIKFNSADFYVTQNFPNTDESIVNLRPSIDQITFAETGAGKKDKTSNRFKYDSAWFYITGTGGGSEDPIVSLGGVEQNNLKLRAEHGVHTGVITGGILSINAGDGALFDLSGGTGRIVDQTDPSRPVITEVDFAGGTGLTITNLASQDVTYILITSAGAILQISDFPDEDQRKDNIFLGILVHDNNSSIRFSTSAPNSSYDADAVFDDFVRAIGPVNVSGNIYSANGANLNVDKSVGKGLVTGVNVGANSDRNQTSVTSTAAGTAISNMLYLRRDASTDPQVITLAAPTDTIDPDNYDLDGVLTSVTSNKFTIQRFIHFPATGVTVIYYGRNLYNSKAEAEQGIEDSFTEWNPTLDFGLLRAYLIVRQGTTDLSNLSDAEFFEAAKFRLSGTSGFSAQAISGVGVEEHPLGTVFDNVSDIIFNTETGFYLSVETSSTSGAVVNFHDHVIDVVAGDNTTVSTQQTNAYKTITVNADVGLTDIPPAFYGVIVQESDGSNTQTPDDTIQFAVADFVVSDNAGKRTADIGPGFYGITAKNDDDVTSFSGLDVFSFETEFFYLTQNPGNTDEVQINLRNLPGAQGGQSNTASNLPGDEGIFFQKSGVDLEFKSLTAGTSITLSSDDDAITINSTGGGGGFYGITVKNDDDVTSFSGLDLLSFETEFFYLTQNPGNTDEVQINLRNLPGAAGGQSNTASNLGAGEGVFSTKVGVDLRFKSLVAGNEITMSSDSDEITINSTSKGFYGIVVKDDGSTVVVT
ncbi:MAG: hypothetical protein ACXABY_24905, partial [Candidatus Thorarchaeota archaeon]